MNKKQFIKYWALRYGVEEQVVETMLDMFTCSLQDVLKSGHSLDLDEVGKFISKPVFDRNFHFEDGIFANLAGKHKVSFIPSVYLTEDV